MYKDKIQPGFVGHKQHVVTYHNVDYTYDRGLFFFFCIKLEGIYTGPP